MKAVRFHRHGGPEVLLVEDIDEPEIKDPGEVLVEIKAASLNRIDSLVRKGYRGIPVKLPHIPGVDMAGVVREIGDGVRRFKPGDRVIATPVTGCGNCVYCLRGEENKCDEWRMLGFQIDGTFRERIVVEERSLIKIPEEYDYLEAATLPLSLLVSWRALRTLAMLKPGERVLVWGATGGTGVMLVKLALSMGAEVIATTRSEWKAEKLESLGVSKAILYRDAKSAAMEVKKLYPDGVDLVIDYLGSDTFPWSIEVAKKSGKVIFFGFESGSIVSYDLRRAYLKHLTLIGTHTGGKWELLSGLKYAAKHGIKPVIDSVYHLDDAVDATVKMDTYKHFGKIILKVSS